LLYARGFFYRIFCIDCFRGVFAIDACPRTAWMRVHTHSLAMLVCVCVCVRAYFDACT
jgi:hypothetical protein